MFRVLYTSLKRRFLNATGRALLDPRIEIGIGTYGVGQDTVLLFRSDDHVTIGRYCSIARGVTIIASGEHNYQAVANYPFAAMFDGTIDRDTYRKGPVNIGHDVWIGAHALILSGVRIGHGAVVAAGSVVSRDVPPYAIVAGVPARILKYRFNEDIRCRLLALSWWDWDPARIARERETFYLPVEEFLTQTENSHAR